MCSAFGLWPDTALPPSSPESLTGLKGRKDKEGKGGQEETKWKERKGKGTEREERRDKSKLIKNCKRITSTMIRANADLFLGESRSFFLVFCIIHFHAFVILKAKAQFQELTGATFCRCCCGVHHNRY